MCSAKKTTVEKVKTEMPIRIFLSLRIKLALSQRIAEMCS